MMATTYTDKDRDIGPVWGEVVYVNGYKGVVIDEPIGFPYSEDPNREWRVAYPGGITAHHTLDQIHAREEI